MGGRENGWKGEKERMGRRKRREERRKGREKKKVFKDRFVCMRGLVRFSRFIVFVLKIR